LLPIACSSSCRLSIALRASSSGGLLPIPNCTSGSLGITVGTRASGGLLRKTRLTQTNQGQSKHAGNAKNRFFHD
jgi:hypothetical protein